MNSIEPFYSVKDLVRLAKKSKISLEMRLQFMRTHGNVDPYNGLVAEIRLGRLRRVLFVSGSIFAILLALGCAKEVYPFEVNRALFAWFPVALVAAAILISPLAIGTAIFYSQTQVERANGLLFRRKFCDALSVLDGSIYFLTKATAAETYTELRSRAKAALIRFAMNIAEHESTAPGNTDTAWFTKKAILLRELDEKIACLAVFDLARGPANFFISEAEKLRRENLERGEMPSQMA